MIADHPDAHVARRLVVAVLQEDGGTLSELVDPQAVWRVDGESPLAGEYRGHQGVFSLLARIMDVAGGSFSQEIVEIDDGDGEVVVRTRVSAARDDRLLDVGSTLRLRVQGGRVVECRQTADDTQAWDAFWA